MQFIFSITKYLSFPEISLRGQKSGAHNGKGKKGEKTLAYTYKALLRKPPKNKRKTSILFANCRSISFVLRGSRREVEKWTYGLINFATFLLLKWIWNYAFSKNPSGGWESNSVIVAFIIFFCSIFAFFLDRLWVISACARRKMVANVLCAEAFWGFTDASTCTQKFYDYFISMKIMHSL